MGKGHLHLWIFLIFGICYVTLAQSIKVQSYQTKVPLGSTWNATCTGDRPVTWTFPNYENLPENKFRISNNDLSEAGLYSATLFISNVDRYDEAQKFSCQYEDLGKSGSADQMNVTVMVEGDDLFLRKPEPSTVINALLGAPVLIPCIPAGPDVTVKLLRAGEDVSGSASFNRFHGFTISNVKIEDHVYHSCDASSGNRKDSAGFILFVQEELKEPIRINASLARKIQVGQPFSLACYIEYDLGRHYYFELNWTEKKEVIGDKSRSVQKTNKVQKGNKIVHYSNLTVANASKIDNGTYTCTLASFNSTRNVSHQLSIYDSTDEFLNLSTISPHIEEYVSATARWVIYLDSIPRVIKYTWLDSSQKDVTSSRRFEIKENDTNPKEIVLTINNVSRKDDGVYTFQVTNGKKNETLKLNLTVKGDPLVKIHPVEGDHKWGDFYNSAVDSIFECEALGFPYPEITWEYEECIQEKPCSNDPSCDSKIIKDRIQEENFKTDAGRGRKSRLTIKLVNNGYLHCTARNELSNTTHSAEMEVKVIDFPSPSHSGFDILGTSQPIEWSDLTLQCSARKLDYSLTPSWYIAQGELMVPLNESGEGYGIRNRETEWSFHSELQMKNIDLSNSGLYFCSVPSCLHEIEQRSILLEVQKIIPPKFTNLTTLNDSDMRFGVGDDIPELVCETTGRPIPNITWFLYDVPESQWPDRQSDNGRKIRTVGNTSYLKIPSKPEFAGKYTCVAENGLRMEKYAQVTIRENHWWVAIVVLLSCAVFVLLIYVGVRRYKEKRARIRLITNLMMKLEKGDPDKINPDLPAHEQVHLLPYDTKHWEFPKEKVTLGKMLGEGAFGMVVKAVAIGIIAGEEKTTVAVKTVKPNCNQNHLEVLVKELKILSNLGRHVNVLNLLGACTQNYANKKELYVIVEYCKYGNLHNYIRRHRNEFKNQVNPATGKIDPAYYTSRGSLSPTSDTQKVAPDGYRLLEEIPTIPEGSTADNSSHYATGSNVRSVCTEISYITNSVNDTEGERRMSADSAWNKNYQGDYQQSEPFSTSDLVLWSFQIARGMDYLSSRNIVHGDLAARNVLLADDKVVKICDFGLAHTVYKEVYNKKDGNDFLPLKWMAIEAIEDNQYSTKSDVWSFGVVLWELFTLGNAPYPGMKADYSFLQSLKEGMRMSKPERATSDIYDIMDQCWHCEPQQRPTFSGIADRLGGLLEDPLRERYIELNEDYSIFNSGIGGAEDYLLKMRAPDCTDSRTPSPEGRYINAGAENLDPDYLQSLPRPSGSEYAAIMMDGNHILPHQMANNLAYNLPPCRSTPESNVPSPQNVFPPMPPMTHRENFGLNGVELTDLSLRAQSPPDTRETHGFLNLTYVPNSLFQPEVQYNDTSISNINYDHQDAILGYNNLSSKVDKQELYKRKKNDSGVSSSSSGQGSDTEVMSPAHNLVDNQNYFNHHQLVSSSGCV